MRWLTWVLLLSLLAAAVALVLQSTPATLPSTCRLTVSTSR